MAKGMRATHQGAPEWASSREKSRYGAKRFPDIGLIAKPCAMMPPKKLIKICTNDLNVYCHT